MTNRKFCMKKELLLVKTTLQQILKEKDLLLQFCFCVILSQLTILAQLLIPIYLTQHNQLLQTNPSLTIVAFLMLIYGPFKMISFILKHLTEIASSDFLAASFEIAGNNFVKKYLLNHQSQYKNHTTSEIITSVQQGQESFSAVIYIFFFLLLPNIISIIGSLFVTIYFLGLKYFFIQTLFLFLIIVTSFENYKKIATYKKKLNRSHLHLYQTIEEIITTKEYIQANYEFKDVFRHLDNSFHKRRLAESNFFQQLGWFEISQSFLIGLSISALMLLGWYDYAKNMMPFVNFILIGTTINRLILPSSGIIVSVRNMLRSLSFLSNWADIETTEQFINLCDENCINSQSKANITAKNLCISKNNFEILKDLNFTINSLGITVITGHNGAGKTTLLRSIVGLETPSSGSIKIGQANVAKLRYNTKAKLFGYVEQNPNILSLLKSSTFLKRKMDDKRRNIYLEELILNFKKECLPKNKIPWAGKLGKNLSKGTISKLRIVKTIQNNPSFLVLDEPFSNLDTISKKSLLNLIIKTSSILGIIIATHDEEVIKEASQIINLSKSQNK